MEILERYLQAVRKYLPGGRQDDIVAELRANMESQLEDKEAELGRPLTQGEAEDWLRAMGAPIVVAARYQRQQYLIGPALFPMYWYVLRLAFLWSLVIYCVANVVAIVVPGAAGGADMAQRLPDLGEAMMRIPGVLMTVAAWVTLVFAALEFVKMHYPDQVPQLDLLGTKWQPSSLPPLEKNAQRGQKKRSYAQAVAEVVFLFLFLGWLALIPFHPFLLMGPGLVWMKASPFTLAPVWWTFYWWLLALNVVQLMWKCVDLLRESWMRENPMQHIVLKIFGMVPLIILLTTRVYVVLKNPAADFARYGDTVAKINDGMHAAWQLVLVIVVLQLAWDVFKLARGSFHKLATNG